MAATRVLFDTPALIDLLERRPRAIARLRALADQGAKLAISILSVAEIHAGIRPGEEKRTARLLDLFDVIPLSEDLARKSGELVAARRKVGRGYTLDDMLIAASAIEFGYLLYTTSRKDFETPRLTFYTPER
jgi:predicted nucleic acid-binding protein